MENMTYSPYNLLPIKNPSTEAPDRTYFYENVVRHLIPDIIDMEANGIPIDLSKVQELETVLDGVLDKVRDELETNTVMLEFLKTVAGGLKKAKIEELENKKKDFEEFIKPFDIGNKVHRTYVVNAYLRKIHPHMNLEMDDWSIKDLKKLLSLISSTFIENILQKKVDTWMLSDINAGMEDLAQEKANIYNKNRVESKINELSEEKLIKSFNPNSPLQAQQFFAYYGITSEKLTNAGNPSWDRDELERLQKLLEILIEEKESEKDQDTTPA